MIDNGAVFWRRYELDHHYSHKHRTISMVVGEGGAIASTIEPNYRIWGDPPASDEQRRRSRDPLSSMVAMSIDIGQSRRCAGAYPLSTAASITCSNSPAARSIISATPATKARC